MKNHNAPQEIQEILGYYREQVNESVQGWFYEPDICLMSQILKWQMELGIEGNICEIGVYHGKSAILLSMIRQSSEKLFLLDIFPEDMEKTAKENIETYGSEENLVWMRMSTLDIGSDDVKHMQPLRLLHIDGSHAHRSVLHELQVFTPFLHQENPVIVVDDFNDPEFPGVSSALFQFLLSDVGNHLAIFAVGQNKAYLCKRGLMSAYQKMVLSFGVNWAPKLSNVLQDRVLLLLSRYPKDKDIILTQLNCDLGSVDPEQ